MWTSTAKQQIDHLQRHGGPGDLLLLLYQADERHHRDEAAGLADGWRAIGAARLVCAGGAQAPPGRGAGAPPWGTLATATATQCSQAKKLSIASMLYITSRLR